MPEQPHVVAVNVGRPAPLAIGDHVVASGIVKHAATGALAVGPLGIEGDEQADRVNHGGPYKAVYAYAREDVAWWEAEIRRPIEPASFGENLTLAGVDVTGARIGERWRIGSVELQVSELRKLVTSAGFRDVRVLIVVASARYPSPAELVRWEAAASPLAGPLGALSTPTRDALVADVAAAIADRLDDDGVLLAQETHVVLARR